MAQVKISSFYGQDVARPYLLIDAETGKPVTDRVNQPSANDPLLKWAKKATFASGGALIGPNSAVEVPKARSEIDIFSEVKEQSIVSCVLFDCWGCCTTISTQPN